MSKFKVFCILALMVLLAVPAYAEVQNVKVSGDLSARWIVRNAYDLDKNDTGTRGDNADDYLMSSAEVQVDADLTDNISTVVRLANQRDWGEPNSQKVGTATTTYDVIVDLANVTFKEFFYAPLTLTVGRQDLWFGKGFIVGVNLRDPKNSITANEYTVITSFDAIKGTLDFDPWTIDGVYALVEENNVNQADDAWLLGLNVGYKFDSYKGETEAYAWYKKDRSRIAYVTPTTTAAAEQNLVSTYGIRGSFEPVQNATLAGELAGQWGDYSVVTGVTRDRKALAYDFSGDYSFVDMRWTPKVGIEYIFYSGESEDSSAADAADEWESWDSVYRGKFDTAIREFQNIYYLTAQRGTNAATSTTDQDAGNTNQQQLLFKGSLKPFNALTLDGLFGWFRFNEAPVANRSKELGTELDLRLTYDYTEDVSFSLLAAWFFPGKYWLAGQDDTATDVVGTVKVAF